LEVIVSWATLNKHKGMCRILVGPNASVMESWLWNLLNVSVALVGYHAAAFSIDWNAGVGNACRYRPKQYTPSILPISFLSVPPSGPLAAPSLMPMPAMLH